MSQMNNITIEQRVEEFLKILIYQMSLNVKKLYLNNPENKLEEDLAPQNQQNYRHIHNMIRLYNFVLHPFHDIAKDILKIENNEEFADFAELIDMFIEDYSIGNVDFPCPCIICNMKEHHNTITIEQRTKESLKMAFAIISSYSDKFLEINPKTLAVIELSQEEQKDIKPVMQYLFYIQLILHPFHGVLKDILPENSYIHIIELCESNYKNITEQIAECICRFCKQ